MYRLPHFIEKDQQQIIAFIREYPFAIITGAGESYPVATQVPLLVEEKGGAIMLHGHIMRKSDHHLAFEKDNHVLVLFTGPHCYVSASWYGNPLTASTWNYMTVQVKGRIFFTDDAGTYDAIQLLTEKYEAAASPSAFDKMTEGYKQQMIKAIVGFTIEVQSMDAVFKLSQNQDAVTQRNIIDSLLKRGEEGSAKIATEMERRLSQ